MARKNTIQATKRARIIKSNDNDKAIVVKGEIAPKVVKTYSFKPITARQQMQRRNNAYQFFSIT